MENIIFCNENLEEIEKNIDMINNEEYFLIKYKGHIVDLMEFQADTINNEYPRYIQFFKNAEDYKQHKYYDSACVVPSKIINYIKNIIDNSIIDMKKNIFLDLDNNKEYTEKKIRELDFEENIADLINNKKEIKEGFINVQSVCECIINSLNGDITKVVKDLNDCWGYNIEIYKIVEEE